MKRGGDFSLRGLVERTFDSLFPIMRPSRALPNLYPMFSILPSVWGIVWKEHRRREPIGSKVDSMSFKINRFLTIVVVVSMVTSAVLVAQPLSEEQTVPATISSESELSSDAAGILVMWEEEKLARDVYLSLYNVWGVRVFSNMARSKQRQMDAMKALADVQEPADPIHGEFQNSELAFLYTSLVEQGSRSLPDAFLVGASIEDLGISNLENQLPESIGPYTITSHTNLLRGSVHHMRSFSRELNRCNNVYRLRHIPDVRRRQSSPAK